MKEYNQFVDQLQQHLSVIGNESSVEWRKKAVRLVDGLAGEELRKLVDINIRRQFGAFFTSSETAKFLFEDFPVKLSGDCVFYDPAVGAGNLLIAARNAAAKHASSITLLGTDLHREFISAAKLRHQINELLHGEPVCCSADFLVANGLVNNKYYSLATHVVTNPPFQQIIADGVEWASGKVSAAALFLDKIISFVQPDTHILAILPDVLRSGSRYEKWRDMVEKSCLIQKVTMLGQFDKYADVDVFSVVLKKRSVNSSKDINASWKPTQFDAFCVEKFYDISVGNVVDNRDKKEGNSLPFVVSRGLEGWKEIKSVERIRKFAGKSIDSPFVVIKRTSRMGDKYRATASIININSPVFVDNHLIVVRPKSRSLADCKSLVKKLQSERVNQWIDQQIRCRHLTVKVVSKIPL